MTNDQLALLGLWSLQGVGEISLAEIIGVFPSIGLLLDVPIAEWLPQVQVHHTAVDALRLGPPLRVHAEECLHRMGRSGQRVAFAGDPAFPHRLAGVPKAAPLLFYVGPGARSGTTGTPVALVGTRHPDHEFKSVAVWFAEEVADCGGIVVSGAAMGVDTLCHQGAINRRAESWAFMGSGLDELDAVPRRLAERLLACGGTVFSDLPPGTRPARSNFPQRNRLISGSSQAVVVLRATLSSGTAHTVRYAIEQSRPVFAVPGDLWKETAHYPISLIEAGMARAVTSGKSLMHALGVTTATTGRRDPVPTQGDPTALSDAARVALDALSAEHRVFDEVLARAKVLESGALASALLELELRGFVLQHPGREYSRR